ncbi:uncharacterized protein LOC113146798 [Cyclospora cayetanensis]|nr:uncharacterized protein LOC113146798 [Cyclospora cayetanensis]
MAATGIYLFGLKNTSFAVAWPQPFPRAESAHGSTPSWVLPVNSFWFQGNNQQTVNPSLLVVSPPMEGPGLGTSPAATAVAKWASLTHPLGASSWGLLALALSLPPLADLLCWSVGFWFFLSGDVRQQQLFSMTVAATMPKHIVVYLFFLVNGASLRVAFFGMVELLAVAALKLLLCTLAAMYASRIESPESPSSTSTKESDLLSSIAKECEEAADVCNCHPFEGCS